MDPEIPQTNIKSNIQVEQGGHLQIEQLQVAHTIHNVTHAPRPVTNALPKLWNAPLENRLFFQRDTCLQIEQKMNAGDHTTLALVAMSGLGGVGKTELAKNFFYHASKNYTSKLWIISDNSAHIESEFRILAEFLNLVEKNAEIQLVVRTLHNFLAEHTGWLMVFDNADESSILEPYLPQQGGDILITSRQTIAYADSIEVDVLSPEQAVLLYQRLSGKPATEAANTLVELLGYLPLAIAQAAAYIKQVRSIRSTEDFLVRFKEYKKDILSTNKISIRNKAEQDRLTIMTTWNLSLDAIEVEAKAQNKACHAREMLIVCAYLANKKIPEALLAQWMKIFYKNESTILDLDSALSQLSNHSLIQWHHQSIQIHKLLQEVIRFQNPLNLEKEISLAASMHHDEMQNLALIPHYQYLINYLQTNSNIKCGHHDVLMSILRQDLINLMSKKLSSQKNSEEYIKGLIHVEITNNSNEIILFISTLYTIGTHYLQESKVNIAYELFKYALMISKFYSDNQYLGIEIIKKLSKAYNKIKASNESSILSQAENINVKNNFECLREEERDHDNKIMIYFPEFDVKAHSHEPTSSAFAEYFLQNKDKFNVEFNNGLSIVLYLSRFIPKIHLLIETISNLTNAVKTCEITYGKQHPETQFIAGQLTVHSALIDWNQSHTEIIKDAYLNIIKHPDYGPNHEYAKKIIDFYSKISVHLGELQFQISKSFPIDRYLKESSWAMGDYWYIYNIIHLLEKNKSYTDALTFLNGCLKVCPDKFFIYCLIGMINYHLNCDDDGFLAYINAHRINKDILFKKEKNVHLFYSKLSKIELEYFKQAYDNFFILLAYRIPITRVINILQLFSLAEKREIVDHLLLWPGRDLQDILMLEKEYPDFEFICLAIAELNFYDEKDIKNATEYYKKYVNRAQESKGVTDYYQMIAICYHLLGENILADSYFKKVIDEGSNSTVHVEYANFLYQNNRVEEAVSNLNKSLLFEDDNISLSTTEKPLQHPTLQACIEQLGDIILSSHALAAYLLIKYQCEQSSSFKENKEQIKKYIQIIKSYVDAEKSTYHLLLTDLSKTFLINDQDQSEHSSTSKERLTLRWNQIALSSTLSETRPTIEDEWKILCELSLALVPDICKN